MQKKKSYTIDPKEYEEDGLLHETAYEELDLDEDCSYPQEDGENSQAPNGQRKSYIPPERPYETPREQVKRLKQELFHLRRKVQKLSAFKRRVEAYDAHYIVDLAHIEYVRVYNPYGCKEAYIELKQDLKDSDGGQGSIADYSAMDTDHLQGSKSYLVYSPLPYCGMDLLLEDMRKCRSYE